MISPAVKRFLKALKVPRDSLKTEEARDGTA
jgi:hypothetical protein